MTDLEGFRDLLRGPAVAAGGSVALEEIVRRGRRLRTRRRVAGGMAGLAVLSVVVGGGVTLWEKTSFAGPAPVEAAAGTWGPAGTWGETVETGMAQPGGQVVLMLSFLKTTGMQSVGCFEAADRSVSGCRSVADFTERTFATGFHAIHAPGRVEGMGELPVFGYFIGPVRAITAKADGRTVTAQLSVWSEDADVTLFWFPLDEVSPEAVLTDWAAFGAGGKPLPTGRARLDVARG